MKKYNFGLVFFIMFLCISMDSVYAHPGRTDSSGCHTCRSNCEKWGLNYGQYHCHNGGSTSSSPKEGSIQRYVYGCTDSESINYNSNANKDDGSCIKKVYGCMDSNAYNYNPNANTNDNSCIAKIYGCIDNKASNYNKAANTSDGSCHYIKKVISYQKIKYKVKYRYKIFSKNGKVLQKGKAGKRRIEKKVILNEQGDILESKVVKKTIVVKPKNKIVVRK